MSEVRLNRIKEILNEKGIKQVLCLWSLWINWINYFVISSFFHCLGLSNKPFYHLNNGNL